jgi:hypothetical protein
MRVVLAVSGYAQAGKDTFADALEQVVDARYASCRFKFAEPLRKATERAFDYLGIKVSPWTENKAEKDKLRPLLVTLGEYARGEDKDVFANLLVQELRLALNADCSLSIITDMRYANEYALLSNFCKSEGHRFLWVHIVRDGGLPANALELQSIVTLRESNVPDGYYRAESGDIASINRSAKDFYETFLR